MSLRLTSSVLALAAFTMPAFADVTPEQVWQSWLDYYTASGYQITEGSREQAGDTLTLKDVTFSTENDGSKVSFVAPEIQMQATGDGKVRSVYAGEMPIHISGENPGGPVFDEDGDMTDETSAPTPYEVTAKVEFPGNEMTSSGEIGDLTHVYNYPTITVSLDKVKSGDEEFAVPAVLTLTGSTGTVHSGGKGAADIDYTHRSDDVAFKLGVDQDGTKVNVDATIKGLDVSGKMTGASADVNMQENLGAALKAGLVMDGKLALGDLSAKFDFSSVDETGAPQSGNGTVTNAATDLTFAMSSAGLLYQGNSGKLDVAMQVAPLPFPISYGVESTSFDAQVPVAVSDEAQPFKIAYSLAGLTIGDQLWDMFDPTKQLPRDPANLNIDVTGQAKVMQDILDPAFTANPEAASPFEPVDIVINQLGLKAIGANIESTGKFDLTGEGGMAQPNGNLNIRFSGVAEAVQKLAQMGLLPPEQVMGVNAMIGAFGKEDPSNPGVRTIDIEMKDGSVFANGQQVQ